MFNSQARWIKCREMYIYSLLMNSQDSELFRTEQRLQKTFLCMETMY